jgi:aryl-alcohol dehydrogenase-like predicted oxidoreductase
MDTYSANNYQNGESEKWIGEWMEKRGVREQIVLATKFTTPFRKAYEGKEIIVNSGGNGTKSLRSSLEMSLKNLKTSYIDLVLPFYPQAQAHLLVANMVS